MWIQIPQSYYPSLSEPSSEIPCIVIFLWVHADGSSSQQNSWVIDEAGATAVSGVESCEPTRGSEVNCLDVGESSDQRNLSADEPGVSSISGAAKDCPQLSRPTVKLYGQHHTRRTLRPARLL